MRSTGRHTLSGVLLAWAAGAMLAAPGQAHGAPGPTVALDRACYSPGEPITQTGSGFGTGSGIAENLSLLDPANDEVLATLLAPPVTTDLEGSFIRRIRAPRLAHRTDRRERAVSTFTDQADPANTWTSVQWTLSSWELEIEEWAAGNVKPGGAMTVDAYGWTSAGSSLYAHYYRGRTPVKHARLGALTGACGDLRRRVRQFPFRRVRPGRWTVFFSTTRKLDKRDDAWISYTVRVPGRSQTASPASTLRWRSVVRRAGSMPSSSTSRRRHSRYCRRA